VGATKDIQRKEAIVVVISMKEPTLLIAMYHVWFPENIEYFDLDVDANGSIDFSLTAAGTLSFAGIQSKT